jgi:hypothetical protein
MDGREEKAGRCTRICMGWMRAVLKQGAVPPSDVLIVTDDRWRNKSMPENTL